MYDLIVIGAGPAGLTAGLYCAQGGFKVLVLEQETIGGQIINIEKIENYPGFVDGISGPQLRQAMANQAINYGVEIKIAEVKEIEFIQKNRRIKTSVGDYMSKAVIIAGGGHPLKLNVPGEEAFTNRGVAYCALCEAGQFKEKTVAVAGGGDAGTTEALYLTKIANKVIIIEVMPQISAKYLLKERVLNNQKIQIICSSKIKAIIGDTQIRSVEVLNVRTNESFSLSVDGVLVRLGWKLNTHYLKDAVPLNDQGEIIVKETMETEIQGVFAAGDIRKGSPRQIATAVGDGAIAGISALKYLQQEVQEFRVEGNETIF